MQSLEVRLQEAAANRLAHGEFLELILQDELNVRHQRLLARRTKAADFRARYPDRKPLFYRDRERWAPLPAEFCYGR